jgi:hypothetical protein
VVHFVVLALALSIAFAAGYAVATMRMRARPPQPAPPSDAQASAEPEPARIEPEPASPEPEPVRMVFAPLATEGTDEWRVAMKALGERMRAADVRLVVFAHGSFVGDDPLAIARAVEDAAPGRPDIARALRGFTRNQMSRLLGDLSNFSPAYIEAFATATGIDAIGYTWSGENHHAARVQGAVRLARALVLHGGGALRKGDRALLVGHSHGGQLFAILSQLLTRAHGYDELVTAAAARGEDIHAMEEHLAVLRGCAIDVTTFGTPPRYGWARGANFRLLHVVNHRGAASSGLSWRGLLHTRQGDYVHQLGLPGFDLPAPTARDRAINAHLDRVLGVGTDLAAWFGHVARGLRVSPHGHTVFVDYGDEGRGLPNFLATGFGHAAYTRREAMLFHTVLLTDHFYPPTAPRPATHWRDRVRGWIQRSGSTGRQLGA